jgi:hypothetical protein
MPARCCGARSGVIDLVVSEKKSARPLRDHRAVLARKARNARQVMYILA